MLSPGARPEWVVFNVSSDSPGLSQAILLNRVEFIRGMPTGSSIFVTVTHEARFVHGSPH